MENQAGVETRLGGEPAKCKIRKPEWYDSFFLHRSCSEIVKLLLEFGLNKSDIYSVNYDFRYIGGKIIFKQIPGKIKFCLVTWIN